MAARLTLYPRHTTATTTGEPTMPDVADTQPNVDHANPWPNTRHVAHGWNASRTTLDRHAVVAGGVARVGATGLHLHAAIMNTYYNEATDLAYDLGVCLAQLPADAANAVLDDLRSMTSSTGPDGRTTFSWDGRDGGRPLPADEVPDPGPLDGDGDDEPGPDDTQQQ